MSSTVERTGEPMSGSGVPLPHETRFVPLTKAKAEQVLPYVLKSIQTLGRGSAVAVGDRGIQLTLPVQLMHVQEATIRESYDRADLPLFAQNVPYFPIMSVPGQPETLRTLIGALAVLPPDMCLETTSIDPSMSAVLVSGPEGRRDFYREQILPGLKAMMNQLGPETRTIA